MKRRTLFVLLCTLLVLKTSGFLVAQGRLLGDLGDAGAKGGWWAWPWPESRPPESIERGRNKFVSTCGTCHAPNGSGTARGVNLLRSALLRHDASGSDLSSLLRSGHGDPKTPQFEPNELTDMVAFLRSAIEAYDRYNISVVKHADIELDITDPAQYPVEKLLTGDPAKGKAFFSGAGGCTTCHSATGDLSGIARKYPPIFLQAKFLSPSRESRTAVVTIAPGEQVSGILITLNNFTVTIRDDKDQSHSWSPDSVKIEVRDPLAAHDQILSKYTDSDVHNMFAYLWTLK